MHTQIDTRTQQMYLHTSIYYNALVVLNEFVVCHGADGGTVSLALNPLKAPLTSTRVLAGSLPLVAICLSVCVCLCFFSYIFYTLERLRSRASLANK